MKGNLWLYIIMLCTAVAGCGHTLKVVSSPSPVNVYFLNSNGTRKGLAGQTPISLSEPRGNEDFYYLEVEKNGFIPQTVVVPHPHSLGSESTLTITLQEQNKDWFEAMARGAFSTQTNDIVTDFIELQTRIIEGSDAEIRRIIEKMKSKYDTVAAFHALVGGYHYSKKRNSEAKASYEKALKLDPNNSDAIQMVKLLKKMK